MRGDFSRISFDPARHYVSVRMQQGRVQLDRDWNEQADIADHLGRTETRDVIGDCGTPRDGEGFLVALAPDGDLLLGPGRMYVEGIVAEHDATPVAVEALPAATTVRLAMLSPDGRPLAPGQWVRLSASGVAPALTRIASVDPGLDQVTLDDDVSAFDGADAPVLRRVATYATQPDLPSPDALAPVPAGGRTDLVYLDVWRRHVSAIEDPGIREEALGGPDTATRAQTVWQVRVREDVGALTCADLAGWELPARDGRLSSYAEAPPNVEDPCVVPPGAGFQGVENALYRVEIHDGSDSGAPTFKWSRDNGSLAVAIEELIDGAPTDRVRVAQLGRDQTLSLAVDDWVEVLDDAAELTGRPGTLARITAVDPTQRVLTLSETLTAIDPLGHPKVVRWDHGSDAVPVTGGQLDLESGVRVRFSGDGFATGDHWVFGARTLTGEVDRLEEAPPLGIEHHTCALALVRWTADGVGAVEDCRPTFPPLTDIHASDVAYDDGACALGAETVQEALDRVCTEVDLPFHKKHLHGWGIVCGLAVHCCDDDESQACRERVELREGYAVDCEGRDVIVREDVSIPLVDLVRKHDEEQPETPILNGDGDGDASLVLESSGDVTIERYDPSWKSTQAMLEGTLLMDFYEDCIKTIVDFIREQFTTPPEEEAKPIAGPTQQRLTTFLNLLIQLVNPTNGRGVFLSEREDAILREFYTELRRRLRSHTFCAMFDGARPFPDYPEGYPFTDPGVATIFGKGFHTRLRIHPKGRLAYSVGASSKIHVYDLDRQELISIVEFPGGEGAIVQDVAFSADGRELHAVALVKDKDSVFGTASIGGDGTEHEFRPVTVLCDTTMVTLGTSPRVAGKVFAVGRGKGIYAIDPANVPTEIAPLVAFNATGQAAFDVTRADAFIAAAATGASTTAYDRVMQVDLAAGSAQTITLRDPRRGQQSATGRDDLAVVFDGAARVRKLYVVLDPAVGEDEKRMVRFRPDETVPPAVIDGLDDSAIRLVFDAAMNQLVVSSEDGYRLELVDVGDEQLVAEYRHPAQISPIALGVSSERAEVYALNHVSNTLTVVPSKQLTPEVDPRLGDLGEYRDGVLEAFTDLFAGFLQYLKDCFCDHLLLKCPTCGEDDKLYLAAVSVRGGRVYQVCNFSRRKYLKTLPGIGYWLSIVPIIPVFDRAIATFCCSVLPRFFSKRNAPAAQPGARNRLKSGTVRTGVTTAQTVDPRALISDWLGELNFNRSIFDDAASTSFSAVTAGPSRTGVARADVVDVPVEAATKRLEAKEVVVDRVEVYDPERVANVVEFTRAPSAIKPGTRVTLYEQDGKVRFYSLSPEPTQVADTAAVREELEVLKTSHREELEARDTELAQLRGRAETLQSRVEELGELRGALDRVTKLETEVKTLRQR